jgi:Adenylate and Guanylate cyclase catalytic domain
MAGVIGADKFSYDVWGETVNLASRLESHGLPGEVQISDKVKGALGNGFVCVPRGPIEVKGVGTLETWRGFRAGPELGIFSGFLLGTRASLPRLPLRGVRAVSC